MHNQPSDRTRYCAPVNGDVRPIGGAPDDGPFIVDMEASMDLYEHLVLQYLTKDAHVFVVPQYSIRGDTGSEWSCPDFVALNFRDKVVSIVEVSSASDPQSLRGRVAGRDVQWVERLREQLKRNRVVDDSWNQYRVEVFIRKEAEQKFRSTIELADDVVIHVLEELGAPWTWKRSYLPPGETARGQA